MKTVKKIYAGIVAFCIAASTALSMTAEAATLPDVTSDFEYELSVTQISDTQLRLTFYTVENPGLINLGVGMTFNPNTFTCTSYDISDDYDSKISKSVAINNEVGSAVFATTVNPDVITCELNDYTDGLSMSVVLEIKNGVIDAEEEYNFKSAVVGYVSQIEGISIERLNAGSNNQQSLEDIDKEIDVMSKQIEYTYYVGDSDLNQTIELADVTMINSLIACSNATNTSSAVGAVNQRIEDGTVSTVVSNNTSINWSSRFSDLLVTSDDCIFACAEASDADKNGIIEQADADLVASYYANHVAGSLTGDWTVNTQLNKIITY